MLCKFHFAETNLLLQLRYIRKRLPPFPVDATFDNSVNLVVQPAARRPGGPSGSSHSSTSGSSRLEAPSESRPAHMRRARDGEGGGGLSLTGGRCSGGGAGWSGSVTLPRPSVGRSGDTAVRHRIEPRLRGCVSRARGSTGR